MEQLTIRKRRDASSAKRSTSSAAFSAFRVAISQQEDRREVSIRRLEMVLLRTERKRAKVRCAGNFLALRALETLAS